MQSDTRIVLSVGAILDVSRTAKNGSSSLCHGFLKFGIVEPSQNIGYSAAPRPDDMARGQSCPDVPRTPALKSRPEHRKRPGAYLAGAWLYPDGTVNQEDDILNIGLASERGRPLTAGTGMVVINTVLWGFPFSQSFIYTPERF